MSTPGSSRWVRRNPLLRSAYHVNVRDARFFEDFALAHKTECRIKAFYGKLGIQNDSGASRALNHVMHNRRTGTLVPVLLQYGHAFDFKDSGSIGAHARAPDG